MNDLAKLVAIDVPSFVPTGRFATISRAQAREGVLSYEASCLMHTV